jgi:hypothetical protein
MPSSRIDFDTVRRIGLALPGVEESTAYGSPALKVRGKLLACVPTHRSAEPGSLAVRVGFDDRAELLAAAPDVYYVTDHYLNHNAVLVRLSRVTPGVLRDLLGMAHKFVTTHAARRSPSRNRRKPV